MVLSFLPLPSASVQVFLFGLITVLMFVVLPWLPLSKDLCSASSFCPLAPLGPFKSTTSSHGLGGLRNFQLLFHTSLVSCTL